MIYTYCDMMLESWNSPLLDNDSLTHVSMEMWIHGDQLWNALSVSMEPTKVSMDTDKKLTFSVETGDSAVQTRTKAFRSEPSFSTQH
jgi:hypothetical protein